MDRKFHFLKYNTFCQSGPFYFLGLERYLLKCFILRMRKFCFPEYKKNIFLRKYMKVQLPKIQEKRFLRKYLKKFQSWFCFILRAWKVPSWNIRKSSGKIRNCLILELESSISWNVRNVFGIDFSYFFELGFKSVPGSSMLYYSYLVSIVILFIYNC